MKFQHIKVFAATASLMGVVCTAQAASYLYNGSPPSYTIKCYEGSALILEDKEIGRVRYSDGYISYMSSNGVYITTNLRCVVEKK